MTTCVILAPGPSLTRAIAEAASADLVGVVCNAYEMRDSADFLAANDVQWWRKNNAAFAYDALRFSCSSIIGVQRCTQGTSDWNSGVLALQVAVSLGATDVELYGFDMHGTHFFGPYTNGLANTQPSRRRIHQQQYNAWKHANPTIRVRNMTAGSELAAYPHQGEQ